MHTYDSPDWADWYDCYFGTYDDDFEFMMELARECKGNILEVGCGTGRLMLPMLKEGIDIKGFDISKPLLEKFKEKAAAEKINRPPIKQASMFDFQYKEKFDLVIIAFRTFNHCPDTDSQILALKNIQQHLKPGGRLVISTFIPHPDLIVNADNAIRVTGSTMDPHSGNPVLVSSYVAEIDSLLQIRTDVWMIEEIGGKPGEQLRKAILPVTMRWIPSKRDDDFITSCRIL